jgi:hypothetical protein
MASEDSVEDLTLRDSPMLTVPVDGVGKADELNEPLATSMPALANQVDNGGEDLVVRYARRKAHVTPEERNHHVPQDLTIRVFRTSTSSFPGFGKIVPDPNSSAAISRSLRRFRCGYRKNSGWTK